MGGLCGAQVLSQIALQLRDMHSAGYVHCSVRAGHILLLPRENRWTLIDFSHAAATGSVCAAADMQGSSAPEAAAASCTAGAGLTIVPQLDSWSLGVVAFEMLTGHTVLPDKPDACSRVRPPIRPSTPLIPPPGCTPASCIPRSHRASNPDTCQTLSDDPNRPHQIRARGTRTPRCPCLLLPVLRKPAAIRSTAEHVIQGSACWRRRAVCSACIRHVAANHDTPAHTWARTVHPAQKQIMHATLQPL